MHGEDNIDSIGLGSQVSYCNRWRVPRVMFQDLDVFLLLVESRFPKGKDIILASRLQGKLTLDVIVESINQMKKLTPWEAILILNFEKSSSQ